METAVSGGDASGSLIDIDTDDFESVLDVRFITVNRIGTRYEAEVILSGDPDVDEARIQQALDVGHTRGVHAYARKHGLDSVLIFFTPDTTSGD